MGPVWRGFDDASPRVGPNGHASALPWSLDVRRRHAPEENPCSGAMEMCFAKGEGISEATYGEEASFVLYGIDKFRNPTSITNEKCMVMYKGPDECLEAKVGPTECSIDRSIECSIECSIERCTECSSATHIECSIGGTDGRGHICRAMDAGRPGPLPGPRTSRE